MMNQAMPFFVVEVKSSRDSTRLEENYWDAKPAVDYSTDSITFLVYLSPADAVHFLIFLYVV